MKKTILIGLSLTITILLLIPSLPAVEVSSVKQQQIQTIYQQVEKVQQINTLFNLDIFHQQSNILSEVSIDDITQLINMIWFESDTLENNPLDDPGDPEPTFFPFLGIFVYLAIAYVFIAINVMVLRFIKAKIQGVIDAIVDRIVQFFENVLSVVMFVLNLAVTIIQGLTSGAIVIGTFILDVVLIIITGILTVLVLILQGIVNTLATIWRGFGEVLRFIIEMITVVIDTLFPIIG